MCCSGFLKMMMFIFNGGIFLAGAAILGVGIWVKVDSSSLLGILENVEELPSGLNQLANVSYLLIAVGAVLLVLGFLGCCGAIKESKCMLLTFFCIVLIIFLIEVAGAVILFVFEHLARDILKGLETAVVQDIKDKYGEDKPMTELWNTTMEQFQCCGFTNYTDFDDSPFYKDNGNVYPPTCCLDTAVKCNKESAEMTGDFCFNKLLQLIEDNALIIAAVAIGVAGLEIAAMVVSLILYCRIGSKG